MNFFGQIFPSNLFFCNFLSKTFFSHFLQPIIPRIFLSPTLRVVRESLDSHQVSGERISRVTVSSSHHVSHMIPTLVLICLSMIQLIISHQHHHPLNSYHPSSSHVSLVLFLLVPWWQVNSGSLSSLPRCMIVIMASRSWIFFALPLLCFLARFVPSQGSFLFRGRLFDQDNDDGVDWFNHRYVWAQVKNGDKNGSSSTEQWFDQTLDHFNPSDTRTWRQVSREFQWYRWACWISSVRDSEAHFARQCSLNFSARISEIFREWKPPSARRPRIPLPGRGE